MYKIDLNSDIGESFGAYKLGDDAAVMEAVTSANVACGFHAGDPLVMKKTLENCAKKGTVLPFLFPVLRYARSSSRRPVKRRMPFAKIV